MKSFLFYFPLRTGNIVYGFTVILATLATASYMIYEICSLERELHNRRNNYNSTAGLLVSAFFGGLAYVALELYYSIFIVVTMVLFIFAVMFVCGIYKENYCLVKSFFIYNIWHLVLTIFIIWMKAEQRDWLGLTLVVISGLVMALCMPSVKYLLDAFKSGNMYTRPGEVMLSPLVEDDDIII